MGLAIFDTPFACGGVVHLALRATGDLWWLWAAGGLLVFNVLISNLAPILTMPLDNAVSRWRENMADDYALESTGKYVAFASAFTRLANQNLGEVNPEKWVVFLFYSHPPLGERIAKAMKYSS